MQEAFRLMVSMATCSKYFRPAITAQRQSAPFAAQFVPSRRLIHVIQVHYHVRQTHAQIWETSPICQIDIFISSSPWQHDFDNNTVIDNKKHLAKRNIYFIKGMVATPSAAAQTSEMERKRKQTLERTKANHVSLIYRVLVAS